MAKSPTIDTVLLKQIVDATNSETGYMFVSQIAAKALAAAGLVEVNEAVTNPADPTQFATRATAKASAEVATPAAVVTSSYAIIADAELPPSKRRGGSHSGAPTKYPFADLPIGGSFFEPNINHKKGDAVKALGSTVSSQNNKYSEPTGEMKSVTRAKRDSKNKAVIGTDGKKEMETVSLPVKSYNRKFAIRPVVSGEKYGNWVAPADGALISRTK